MDEAKSFSLDELTVSRFISTDLVLIGPHRKVKEAKEIMRIKKITGIPVVNDTQRLIGILSIADILNILESSGPGGLETRIGNVMTKDVEYLRPGDSIIRALDKFRSFGFGRLPVVDEENRVIGILTPSDIILRLTEYDITLSKKHQLQAGISNIEVEYFFDSESENDNKAETSYSFPVTGGDFNRAGEASSSIKNILKKIGISPAIVRRVAIAAYEAEMNIVIHAYRGSITVKITPDQIEIRAADEGPGIKDLELAMREGYSTAPDKVRELGFGAGMGLPNMKKCTDEMYIDTEPGVGTTVTMIIKLLQ